MTHSFPTRLSSDLMYSARIEPLGSASTISVLSDTLAKKRASPVMVPPEPTPQTMASTSCSICSQISGPVVASWACGLAGLTNWLMSSDERRVGKECVRPCRSRWVQDHKKKTIQEPIPRDTIINSYHYNT